MDQNIKRMVKALAAALIIFKTKPICTGSDAKTEKKAPNIWNNGAPGGCPTSSFDEVSMYSPVSQNPTVGSTVNP